LSITVAAIWTAIATSTNQATNQPTVSACDCVGTIRADEPQSRSPRLVASRSGAAPIGAGIV
jgi:hypothetical protein